MTVPKAEIRTVSLMYQWLILEGLGVSEIATRLNSMKVERDGYQFWTYNAVRNVLCPLRNSVMSGEALTTTLSMRIV